MIFLYFTYSQKICQLWQCTKNPPRKQKRNIIRVRLGQATDQATDTLVRASCARLHASKKSANNIIGKICQLNNKNIIIRGRLGNRSSSACILHQFACILHQVPCILRQVVCILYVQGIYICEILASTPAKKISVVLSISRLVVSRSVAFHLSFHHQLFSCLVVQLLVVQSQHRPILLKLIG